MQVYQTDHEGFYIGLNTADPDPMLPNNWLIPGGCVTVEPPMVSNGQRAKWVNDSWIIIGPEPELEPVLPSEPTYEELLAQAENNRKVAYHQEADPLFFKAQRGSATQQEWLDKIAEIKLRYPDPEILQ